MDYDTWLEAPYHEYDDEDDEEICIVCKKKCDEWHDEEVCLSCAKQAVKDAGSLCEMCGFTLGMTNLKVTEDKWAQHADCSLPIEKYKSKVTRTSQLPKLVSYPWKNEVAKNIVLWRIENDCKWDKKAYAKHLKEVTNA